MATPVIDISVSDWVDVPDNPVQRDTERRARSSRHLDDYSPMHCVVMAATIRGEIRWKIDGHTRAYRWHRGLSQLPPDGKVTVLLFEVRNAAGAKALYEQADSGRAVMKPCDRIFGATRENKFALGSPLLIGCAFFTQLKLADTGTFDGDPYKLVKKWKRQLIALDGLGLTARNTILIAPMLLAIRRDHVEKAGPFWSAVDADAGTKDKRGRDGVQALSEHMAIRRAEKRTAGYDNLKDIIERAWWCYEAWRQDRRCKRIGRISLGDIITSVHGTQRRSTCQSLTK